MSKSRIIATIIVATLLGISMAGLRHVRRLDNQIQFKQIEIQNNDAKLKLLDKKYQQLNKDLESKDADKIKAEEQLKQLEQERLELQKALQAKKEQKERDIAAKAQKAVTGTQVAYAATNGCEQLGAKMSRLGVTGAELDAALILATRESSCRSSAVNASSGACGEFQSYPCGKWGTPGTDQYLQNAINYARGRYGSYQAALAFSYANNWY